jgi:immune inhibitor A
LEDLARAFEEQMVPTNRAFFGDEWNPGIDNDPHIYIVYTGNIGSHAAGVFVSGDEVHPLAEPQSNAAELFMVNSSNTSLGENYAYTVLAHEHQHMIHWYRDRNETSWINEGMSELAAMLNGYVNGGFVYQYLFDTDLQLNDWPNDQFATSPHYGAGFLFVTYFLDRFGAGATQALVGDQANGLESVDNTLAQLGLSDPLTQRPLTADDVVLDWAVANYVADASVGDGRYAYQQYPDALEFQPLSVFEDCDANNVNTDVRQFGVDYISFACSGQRTLRFEGSNRTLLLPANAYSGDYMFWSNKGDESDMTLTRAFDFSQVTGPLTLSYQTWYDIETDWDYVYVLASTDQGDAWTFLETPNGTSSNPLGNNYNFGYTGLSGGDNSEWIQQSVDLSPYAGQQVLLRFEYITDAAVNGEGFLLDDVEIEKLDYFEDFEGGEGGWVPAGFARVQNVLPQTFRLALISLGAEKTVQIIEVPETNQIDIPMDFDVADEIVLVVVGTTRFTRQPAVYRFGFLP